MRSPPFSCILNAPGDISRRQTWTRAKRRARRVSTHRLWELEERARKLPNQINFQCALAPFTCSQTFTNFQTGLNMDATDDFVASAIAGGPVTSLV